MATVIGTTRSSMYRTRNCGSSQRGSVVGSGLGSGKSPVVTTSPEVFIKELVPSIVSEEVLNRPRTLSTRREVCYPCVGDADVTVRIATEDRTWLRLFCRLGCITCDLECVMNLSVHSQPSVICRDRVKMYCEHRYFNEYTSRVNLKKTISHELMFALL